MVHTPMEVTLPHNLHSKPAFKVSIEVQGIDTWHAEYAERQESLCPSSLFRLLIEGRDHRHLIELVWVFMNLIRPIFSVKSCIPDVISDGCVGVCSNWGVVVVVVAQQAVMQPRMAPVPLQLADARDADVVQVGGVMKAVIVHPLHVRVGVCNQAHTLSPAGLLTFFHPGIHASQAMSSSSECQQIGGSAMTLKTIHELTRDRLLLYIYWRFYTYTTA